MLEEFENYRNPSRWAQLGFLLRFIGFALLGYVLVVFAYSALPRPLSTTAQKLFQMVFSTVVFGVPAFIFARMTFRDRPLYHLGFRPAERKNFYLLAILLLLFAFPLEEWLGVFNKHLPLPHWMVEDERTAEKTLNTLLAVKSSFDIVVNLIVVAVIPGIFEEMFFRGVVQRLLIQLTKRPWLGIVIAGFVFSFLHFEFEGFLPRMFLGILLGAAYWYSGSLWTPVLAHCFFNGIQVLAVTYYPTMMNTSEDVHIPAYATLISLVIVVGLLATMRAQSTLKMSGSAGTKSI